MLQTHIKPKNAKRIPVKVYEEIKNPGFKVGSMESASFHIMLFSKSVRKELEWVNNNGIETPYLVIYV